MLTETRYVGIDPGALGGMACLTKGREVAFTPMPDAELVIYDWLLRWSDKSAFAVIEQVQGHIGRPQPGSAMFNFGVSYGGLRMALVACGIPFEAVPPQQWQKALGVPKRKKSDSDSRWKNKLKREAERLFPDLVVTLATADALLIAHYCRLVNGGA